MKNDYQIGRTKISIPPTILYSVIGFIRDVRQAVTMDAKHPGDLVYIVGETKEELGGSEWFALQKGIGNTVPRVNAANALKIYRALHRAMQKGVVASCHDCSDGGMAVAMAETALAGMLGMDIDLKHVPYTGRKRNDYLLFSETASRFIVTVHPENQRLFDKIMTGNVTGLIGCVTEKPFLEIRGLEGKTMIRETLKALKKAWQKTLNF